MVYLTTLTVSEIIQCRTVELLVNNHLERMWKEAVVTEFEAFSWHLPAETEESHVYIRHNSRGPG
jgi:hypothetical protein